MNSPMDVVIGDAPESIRRHWLGPPPVRVSSNVTSLVSLADSPLAMSASVDGVPRAPSANVLGKRPRSAWKEGASSFMSQWLDSVD